MPRLVHSKRSSALGLAAGLVAVAMIACTDSLTLPHAAKPAPAEPRGPQSAPHRLRAGEASTLEVSINADPVTGGGSAAFDSTRLFGYASWVTVTASGTVTATPTYNWLDSSHHYGPSGASWIGSAPGWGDHFFQSLGSDAQSETDTMLVLPGGPTPARIMSYPEQSVTLDMFQAPPRPKVECGPQSNHPEIHCYAFAGSRSFTLTPISADLVMRPESSLVTPGSNPWVDYRATPESLHVGNGWVTTPFIVDSTHWIPDSPDSAGSDASEQPVHVAGRGACQDEWGTGCRRHIVGSGTFIMTAFVNGMLKQKSVHIAAATLKLTPPRAMVHVGDSADFTPSWSNGAAIPSANWSWTPNSMPGATVACASGPHCRAAIRESGTMTASVTRNGVTKTASASVVVFSTFKLVAAPVSIHRGDSVTFTPEYDNVPGPAARWRWEPDNPASPDTVVCPVGASSCKRSVLSSGTMWAYSSLAGGDSSGKHIDVAPNKLTLSSSADFVYAGELATFAATSSDGPVDVIAWTWTNDPTIVVAGARRRVVPRSLGAGRASVDNGMLCTAHLSQCTDTVVTSGAMHVRATVHGDTLEDSVHVQVGDLDNLAAPPAGIDQPDLAEGNSNAPQWCPGDYKVYLQSTIIRGRLKMLYDSTIAEHKEHGSFGFADSVSHALSVGPVLEGDSVSVPAMKPPPNTACISMHAHPKGQQYKLGPSPDDIFYSWKWSLAGFVITKDYVFYMDTNWHAQAVAHRTP